MGNPGCPDKKPFFEDPDTEALRIEIQEALNKRFSHMDEEPEEQEEDDNSTT